MLSKQIENFRDGSDSRTLGTRPLAECIRKVPATRRKYSRKAASAAGLGALFVISFATMYRVRELVAMLLLFTIAFVVVMIGALMLWFAEQAAHRAAVWIETHVAHLPERHAVVPARAQSKSNSGGRPWS
jgi:hypothetical protein